MTNGKWYTMAGWGKKHNFTPLYQFEGWLLFIQPGYNNIADWGRCLSDTVFKEVVCKH